MLSHNIPINVCILHISVQCMYLNNVFGCCAHIIWVMEKMKWARILGKCSRDLQTRAVVLQERSNMLDWVVCM